MRNLGLGSANRPSARLAEILSLLPVAVAGAFAVMLAVSIRGITAALTWNADFVSPMVLADRLGTAHGSDEVVFGTYAPLTTLWFNIVTKHLPSHGVLWKLAPLMLSVVGLTALGWAVWQVAGRWAATLTVAIGFCASTPVLTIFLAQANHGPAYFVMCILAAFLVFISTRPATPVVVAAAVLLGIAAGLNVASDPLLLLVGMAPFLGAPLLVFARRRSPALRRVILLAAGITGLSLVVALVTTRAADSAGYGVLGVSEGNPLAPAPLSQVWANFDRLIDHLLDAFNADFAGTLGFTTPARVLLAGLALAGVCVPVTLLVRSLTSREPSSPQSARDGSALVLLEVYWGLVVAGLIAGLVFSQLAAENAPRSIGYIAPLFLAVAVTVPIVASRSLRWRAAVGVAAALFCGLSLLSVAQREIPKSYDRFAYVRDGNEVLRILEERGLRRGYASYGSAAPLTFKSGDRIRVSPVILCPGEADRLTLCGFPANRVKSWYTPEAGPSFVIADPTLPWPISPPPPTELGTPSQILAAGSQTVFVYPYDVASRFGNTL